MLSLFFVDQLSSSDNQTLDGDEGYHAVKVLRLAVGEKIKVSDGKGNWAAGAVVEVGKKTLQIKVTERGQYKVIKPELIVVQAVTKSDRNKEMLELVTAAGVDQIIPWQADRSISKWQADSEKKWQSTIKEACKQSRRVKIPQLQMAMSTKQIIEHLNSDKFVLIFDAESDLKFADITMPSDLSAIYLIIGPEGGISDEELVAFKRLGASVVKLGEPVLRSAHAGFAALAAVQSRLGRW